MKRQRAMMSCRQRGSAMLITMILIAALLGGAAVLAGIQLASTRSSDLTRTGTLSTYCAEAGLALARPIVLANYSTSATVSWTQAIALTSPLITAGTTPAAATWEPAWLTSGIGCCGSLGVGSGHDLDGDGVADFFVYLKDNDDELTVANNRAVDADLKVFIVSRCIKYPDAIREVEELVQYSGGGTCYQGQQGGCGGNNNAT